MQSFWKFVSVQSRTRIRIAQRVLMLLVLVRTVLLVGTVRFLDNLYSFCRSSTWYLSGKKAKEKDKKDNRYFGLFGVLSLRLVGDVSWSDITMVMILRLRLK